MAEKFRTTWAKTQPLTHATPTSTSNEPSQKSSKWSTQTLPHLPNSPNMLKKTHHQQTTHFTFGPGGKIAMTQNLCACLGELVDKICSGDPKPLEAAAPVVRAAPAPAPAPPPRALPVEVPAATLAVPNVPLETEKSEVGLEVWKPMAIEHTINGIRWGTCGFSDSQITSVSVSPRWSAKARPAKVAAVSALRVADPPKSGGSRCAALGPCPQRCSRRIRLPEPSFVATGRESATTMRERLAGMKLWDENDESGWKRKGIESGWTPKKRNVTIYTVLRYFERTIFARSLEEHSFRASNHFTVVFFLTVFLPLSCHHCGHPLTGGIQNSSRDGSWAAGRRHKIQY